MKCSQKNVFKENKQKLCKTISVARGIWVLGEFTGYIKLCDSVSEWKSRQGQMGSAQGKSSRVGCRSRWESAFPGCAQHTRAWFIHWHDTVDPRSSCGCWSYLIHTEYHTQFIGVSSHWRLGLDHGCLGSWLLQWEYHIVAVIQRWYSSHSGEMEEVPQSNHAIKVGNDGQCPDTKRNMR